MSTRRFALAAALAVAMLSPAGALERRGTASLQWPDGRGPVHEFRTSYDPASGALARSGTIRLADGRTITYEANGRCEAGLRACNWNGTGTGPFGGRWRIEGRFARETDGDQRLEQVLTAPSGQRIEMRHRSSGDVFPVDLR